MYFCCSVPPSLRLAPNETPSEHILWMNDTRQQWSLLSSFTDHMIRREENRNPFLAGASGVSRLSIVSERKGNRQMMALGKFCRVFNSQSPSILFWPTLMLLLTSMASTPGTALTATSQTGYIFSQPDQETHSTIRVWIMLDLSLGIKNKSLFSPFHFPFSLFPFRQEFTTLQTVPSNKRFTFSNTANKGDHRNDHLMLKTIHCIETNIKGGREDDWPGHKYIICDKATISPATQLSSSALAHTTSPHWIY